MSLDNVIQGVQSVSNLVGSGQNAVNRLAGDLGAGSNTSWRARLKPAQFRGKEFAVLEGHLRFGRHVAVHEYPFRDGVWVEDLGRSARRIAFSGFIVGDDVIARRDDLMRVCEDPGAVENAELQHPTLGKIKVALLEPVECVERWDRGRVFELSFSFIEQGQRKFPGASVATGDAVQSSAAAVKAAASAIFVKNALSALKSGAAALGQLVNTVATWSRSIQRMVNDATNLYSFVQSLPGEFGRLFGGGNGSRVVTPGATIPALVALGAANRATAAQATSNFAGAVQTLQMLTRARGTPEAVAASLASVTTAAAATASTAIAVLPASVDALRLSLNLVSTAATLPGGAPAVRGPISVPPASTAQAAARMATLSADLLRRSVVVEAALLASRYQPTSYDDANAVKTLILTQLDAEMLIAGDQAEDDVFTALHTLRTAVLQDLTARGASLAPLVSVTTPMPVPAPVLAQRLYRDGNRVADIVSRGNPVHPAFMPVHLTLLAS